MISAVCPACGVAVDEDATMLSYPGREAVSGPCPEEIRCCGRCGHGFAWPMLSEADLERLYEGAGYWQGGLAHGVSVRERPLPHALAAARWECIRSASPAAGMPLSILDIGAGPGYLGHAAVSTDPQLVRHYCAVEPDPQVVDCLRASWEALDIAVPLTVHSSLEEVPDGWDVVVLSHVLEHVVEPVDLLAAAASRIQPPGTIFIDVPSKDYEFKANVFPHLQFFTVQSLSRMLDRISLTPVEVQEWGRPQRHSPANDASPTLALRLGRLIVRAVGRPLALLPAAVSPAFYGWWYGAGRKSPGGTWIRAVGKKTTTSLG